MGIGTRKRQTTRERGGTKAKRNTHCLFILQLYNFHHISISFPPLSQYLHLIPSEIRTGIHYTWLLLVLFFSLSNCKEQQHKLSTQHAGYHVWQKYNNNFALSNTQTNTYIILYVYILLLICWKISFTTR